MVNLLSIKFYLVKVLGLTTKTADHKAGNLIKVYIVVKDSHKLLLEKMPLT